MPYSHIDWGGIKTQLSARLDDGLSRFWTNAELTILLSESLRTFGLCSGFWRERGTLTSSDGTVFYDLPSILVNSLSEPLLSYTITDRDLIQQIQLALLEDSSDQTQWLGTEQFTYDDIVNAIQHRRDQFLSDTGIVVTRSLVPIAPPPDGRQTLSDDVIDIRRAAFLDSTSTYYNVLWREDERLLTAADQSWSTTPGYPECYSVMAPPPLELQISPLPQATGSLELLTVNTGSALDPATSATSLGIPDDLTPAIKWGALADLLGKDGLARDPFRAQFAEQRYQQYVQLARMLPVVIHAEINGAPLVPSTLFEMDSSTPDWQNSQGTPSDIVLAAPNLIALANVPDDVYSVTLDVVRKTPIPASDGDYVQIGREQLDMILDYAEHLALFKVGGMEWHATDRQAQNFLMQALTYNQRISAASRAVFSAGGQSQRQKQGIPRRLDSDMGVGALKGLNAGH